MTIRRAELAHRRRLLGLSQDELAARLRVDRSTVARWERGDTEPQPWMRTALCAALRLNLQQLDSLLAGAVRPELSAPANAVTMSGFAPEPGGRATTFPSATASGLAQQSCAEAGGLQFPSSRNFDSFTASDLRTSSGIVEFHERLMIDFAAFDNANGPTQLIETASRYATQLTDDLAIAKSGMWAALAHTAARYSEFVGWLHQDAGDTTSGAHWTEQALSLAHACGDSGLVAYALMRRSNQAAEQSETGMALGLAEAALGTGGASTARIRALGYRQKAAGLALAQDRVGCAEALSRAREAIAADPQWNPLTGYCTLHYLDAEAAVCHLRLGQVDRAVELLAPAIDSWSAGYVRDRGFYQAHFAEALIRAGHLDEGMAHARQAASLATVTESGRTFAQIKHVLHALETRGSTGIATDLRLELADALE